MIKEIGASSVSIPLLWPLCQSVSEISDSLGGVAKATVWLMLWCQYAPPFARPGVDLSNHSIPYHTVPYHTILARLTLIKYLGRNKILPATAVWRGVPRHSVTDSLKETTPSAKAWDRPNEGGGFSHERPGDTLQKKATKNFASSQHSSVTAVHVLRRPVPGWSCTTRHHVLKHTWYIPQCAPLRFLYTIVGNCFLVWSIFTIKPG